MKLIESFGWGIAAALGSLVLQELFTIVFGVFNTGGDNVVWAKNFTLSLSLLLPVAVIAEEVLKYIVITKRIESYSFGRGVMAHAMLVGAGFAAAELFLLAQNFVSLDALLRIDILGIAAIHIATAGFIGYATALHPRHTLWQAVGIVFTVSVVHGAYNALILFQDRVALMVPLALAGGFFLLVLVLLARVNRRLAED